MGAATEAEESPLVDVDAAESGVVQVGTNWRSTPVGGGVQASYVDTATDRARFGLRRESLIAHARRVSGERRSARAQVALIVDDYPAATLDTWAPLAAARGLPWGWALNGDTFDAGYAYATFSEGKSWADVKALDPAVVEVINHGSSHRDVTSVDALHAEIVGSRDRIRAETGRPVLGWSPPGCDFPEGINYKSSPLMHHRSEEDYAGTEYARLCMDYHAWVTGTHGGYVHRLTGLPRPWMGRVWLDGGSDSGVKEGGTGDTAVQWAIEQSRATILSLHACYIEGASTLTARMTRAGIEAFLDRLAARRDAGGIDIVLPTPLMYTTITA